MIYYLMFKKLKEEDKYDTEEWSSMSIELTKKQAIKVYKYACIIKKKEKN